MSNCNKFLIEVILKLLKLPFRFDFPVLLLQLLLLFWIFLPQLAFFILASWQQYGLLRFLKKIFLLKFIKKQNYKFQVTKKAKNGRGLDRPGLGLIIVSKNFKNMVSLSHLLVCVCNCNETNLGSILNETPWY